MSVTLNSYERSTAGNQARIEGSIAWGNYTAGGDRINASSMGLSRFDQFEITGQEQGYLFESILSQDGSSVLLKVYKGGVSTVTPAGTVSQPTFTGSNPGVAGNVQVNHNAAPAANPIMITWLPNGEAAIGASLGADFAKIAVSNGDAIAVATPDTAYDQIYFKESTNEFLVNNSFFGVDQYVRTLAGGLLKLKHDVDAAIHGVAVNYTEGSGLLEATFVSATNHVQALDVTKVEIMGVPAGTVSQPSFTGVQIASAPATEVANATSLVSLNKVEFQALGR